MGGTPKHIDLIELDVKLKVSEIASILFQLEMKGAVMAQAGKQFKTILAKTPRWCVHAVTLLVQPYVLFQRLFEVAPPKLRAVP